jgi:hypothetical protein
VKTPISNPVFVLLALAGLAAADVPKKAPITKYSGLWVNSPFTSKPLVDPGGPEENPLDDYALIGVSPIGGTGHRVTLINKKKPDERITVDSDSPKSGFKILNVTRKAGDPLGTVVSMESGKMKGTVRFDEKLLTLVKAAPPAPQPGQPQPGQPQLQPGQPQPGRQPRPRVVPPPTQQPGDQGQQQIPQQPVQQVQQQGGRQNPQVQQNNQRPSRRGN